MASWLKNLFQTKPEPPNNTEILARIVELEAEWQSFLEMQARIARRAAKRVKDEAKGQGGAPDAPESIVGASKAELRRIVALRRLAAANHRTEG